jgi:hypothetical protein
MVQGVFLTCGLNHQLTHTLRAGLWFGVWFAITIRPRSWAEEAEGWNKAARKEIWMPTFIRVHAIMWRLLLSYLLYSFVGLLAAAVGKALSLQFHHKNHFARMQVRSGQMGETDSPNCVIPATAPFAASQACHSVDPPIHNLSVLQLMISGSVPLP